MPNEFDREDYVGFLLSQWGEPSHPAPFYAGLMEDIVELIRGKTILDAGCGFGHLLAETRKQYGISKSYTGLDMSPAMIQYARNFAPDDKFVLGDIRTYNIIAETTVCVDVLIHQSDIKPFIENMWNNSTLEIIFTMNTSANRIDLRARDGPITFENGLVMNKITSDLIYKIVQPLPDLDSIEEFKYDDLTSIFRVTKSV